MGRWGQFHGHVKTIWKVHNGEDRNMQLLEEFGYTDPGSRKWTAEGKHNGSPYEINGASIPRIFWSSVGPPYVGNYRRAAVLHDAGYVKKVDADETAASRRQVDNMFYHSMRCDGVGWFKATLMYLAVCLGGGSVWDKSAKPFVVTREIQTELEELEEMLLEKGELDFDELEKLADSLQVKYDVVD